MFPTTCRRKPQHRLLNSLGFRLATNTEISSAVQLTRQTLTTQFENSGIHSSWMNCSRSRFPRLDLILFNLDFSTASRVIIQLKIKTFKIQFNFDSKDLLLLRIFFCFFTVLHSYFPFFLPPYILNETAYLSNLILSAIKIIQLAFDNYVDNTNCI